jgi:hypothetical protein
MTIMAAALIMTQQAGSAAGAGNLNSRPAQQTASTNHVQHLSQQHSNLMSLDNGVTNNTINNYASSTLLQSTPSSMLMSSTLNDHHLAQHHATLHDIVQHRLSPSKGTTAHTPMHMAGMKRERDHTPNAGAQPPAEVGHFVNLLPVNHFSETSTYQVRLSRAARCGQLWNTGRLSVLR